MENKTSNSSQFILWLGAAISIAEILTGALLAPLGLSQGIAAILIGHTIGGVILYLCGIIGAQSKLSSIESTRISFGKYGSFLFSILNIVQLLGWTAVMIINGSKALDAVSMQLFNFQNETVWCIIIGALIALWIGVGVKSLSKINTVAVAALFLSTIVLGFIVFTNNTANVGAGGFEGETLNFGTAVELNVTMALSWIPLISDYTKNLKSEKAGTLASALGYCIGSTFMFIIGLGASLYAGTSDISGILLSAGLGTIALIIVIFSTVTTTFLDAYSAGVSFTNINKCINEKTAGLIVCGLGIILSIVVSIDQYEDFLYLIGSVFAPLFAISITDYFIFNKKSIEEKNVVDIKNIIIWIIGVFAYRILMQFNSIVGITIPVMIGIALLCILINLCLKAYK
ncbi:putative hydroxymethylpyrimidine transporter CytX [Clostridium saccharobutylicum]|uniref:Putative permease n=1 Tax=Clostridium saccharobutylicum DSM 13864 TaxID=1345695 RepID=U5N0D0_CLOSA|nr:putative hydroxymethylpyrimidine transporter CytX [Clostridium saccharobutylicum]AGX45247.1 putative permease [Clostridium saccharobutylicum DSM 13864]AQR92523.1 cytosine permease [Clostridium saccharobutylicum]AQS02426.1 cytosine permease [Clostridium saccharobutylicum]AQS16409.1 cytosine permease [Clostridium saccharobutylicum]MBA2906812.1 putative hydroxymethylpyrimidine transporter CytX [Clostridium saccharobutylicum]